LRLVVHAADCLAGEVPQPTPADGPAWAAERWRAFAGGTPTSGRLPDADSAWREADPLGATLDQLTKVAGFEPLAAVALSAGAIHAASANDPLALGAAPPEARRQAALTRALLALRGIGETTEARSALAIAVDAGDGEDTPLVSSDPLAYALDRLLISGLRGAKARVAVLPGTGTLPPSLAWAAPLLAGTPSAPAEIWRLTPERPREGLAAALIMQELAGLAPDWSLLAEWPGFTVPLALLIPLPGAAPPVDPPQMPVAPIVP
jgi:hypothetical protein